MCNRFFFLLIAILIFCNACNVINPEEEIPGYIAVDTFLLTTNTDEGTASHNITDVWVSVDGNLLGGIELPATIPVFGEGLHDVVLFAGIKRNGIAATRVIYEFYDSYAEQVNITEKEITLITPVIGYEPQVNFSMIEDFEGAGNQFIESSFSAAEIEVVSLADEPENVFEGNKSALIELTEDEQFIEAETALSFQVPGAGVPIALEINYKCEADFSIFIKSESIIGQQEDFAISVRESPTWKKIYVNLDNINNIPSAASYKIVLKASKPETLSTANIYLDNIKVIRF